VPQTAKNTEERTAGSTNRLNKETSDKTSRGPTPKDQKQLPWGMCQIFRGGEKIKSWMNRKEKTESRKNGKDR